MLAGHDVNVDVADTEAGYRRHLPDPGLLHIARYPDAKFVGAKDIEASTVKSTLVALVAPRSLFAPGALSAQRDFVAGVAIETTPGP